MAMSGPSRPPGTMAGPPVRGFAAPVCPNDHERMALDPRGYFVCQVCGERYQITSPVAQEDTGTVTEVRYAVSPTPKVGRPRARSMKVTFSSGESCEGVHVRMVALPGEVMPASAERGVELLDTTLALEPGVPAEYHVTVPRQLRRPYHVRCFLVGGRAKLIDPPTSSLKET